jgi:hypothetical protein
MNRPETIAIGGALGLAPKAAVERLISLHDEAAGALRDALDRFFTSRVPPSIEERRRFRYPELKLLYTAEEAPPSLARNGEAAVLSTAASVC